MAETFHLSEIEKEVVALTAAFDLINGTVNYEVLEMAKTDITQVGFKSSTHLKYFSIMLADFLSKPNSTVFGLNDSYLDCLRAITDNSQLGDSFASTSLKRAALSFSNWLEDKALYEKAWFPSIELQTDLSIKRFDLIDFCGNISKHNFTRLTRVAKKLRQVFKGNGHVLNLHQSLSILEEFQEQFHNNVLSYHTTTIAAFPNEIRWGIYEYLLPTYQKSLILLEGDPPAYKYTYPNGIINEFARECFWSVMNKVRSEPYVPKFSAPDYLRLRY